MIAAGYCAVVFDLDGTLADTAIDIRESLVRALAGEGLPPVDLASVRLMIGGGPRLLVRRALERLGVDEDGELVERLARGFFAEYKRQNHRQTHLFDGAESTLRQLHETGIRVGLCSNKPDELCRLFARNFRLECYIDEIIGSDDGRPKKPDPAPLLAVIERLGVPPGDTLYVGDSATDVTTARAAKVPVMLVNHGYSLRAPGQLGADGVLESLTDLVEPGPYLRSA